MVKNLGACLEGPESKTAEQEVVEELRELTERFEAAADSHVERRAEIDRAVRNG